jgi:hypothetical protein
MASKKRANESYAQYLLRISGKPSSVYTQKPKPKAKPQLGSVEQINKAAAATSKPSEVFKEKPKKVGSVEWMASQGKPKPKAKPKPAEVKPAKPPVRGSEQKPTVQKPAVKPAAKPAEKPKPMTQMGDVRGSKFEGGPSANEKMTIGKKVEGMEATPGVKADGTDMERRRAFLDADNSMKGMKAVRELLEKRKKEQKIKRQ